MAKNLNPLPDFFPKVAKECNVAGSKFMECFSTHATKENSVDIDAGIRGLKSCARELVAYEACMKKHEVKQLPKRYRVQEEYRAPQSSHGTT